MFAAGDRVRLVGEPWGTGTVTAGPPQESVHGMLYGIDLDSGLYTVSVASKMEPISAVDQLAALTRGET